MEPSKASRIRDLVTAALIAIGVLLLFVTVTFQSIAFRHASSLSQEAPEGSAQDDSLPPKQIEQYVAVYRAMQHNHSLTIEQACAQQGLTVQAFRAIERKVERDDQVQARVREELKPKTAPAAHPSP